MDTDVVRELTDPARYNLCKPIAAAMGLDTRSDATLWKDKAVHLVNEAVMSSFTSAGWKLVDHHTVLAEFAEWYKKEKAKRGYCAGAPRAAALLAALQSRRALARRVLVARLRAAPTCSLAYPPSPFLCWMPRGIVLSMETDEATALTVCAVQATLRR